MCLETESYELERNSKMDVMNLESKYTWTLIFFSIEKREEGFEAKQMHQVCHKKPLEELS